MWTELSKEPNIYLYPSIGIIQKYSTPPPTFHAVVLLLNPSEFDHQALEKK